jgi:hypothetical protein
MAKLLPYQNLSLEDMDGEIWKDIEGLEGYYEISSLGRVKSLSRLVITSKSRTTKLKILKGRITKYGYINITITFNAKQYGLIIHRVVAQHFINNLKNKKEVNHIDGNKLNNNVHNLEWVSSLENKCHQSKFIVNNKTSKYIGVSLNKDVKTKKWRSTIRINQKIIYLGSYYTEEEAYKVRCEYEKNNKIENKYL